MKVIYYDNVQKDGKAIFEIRHSDKEIWFLQLNRLSRIDLDDFNIEKLENSIFVVSKDGKEEYGFHPSLSIPEFKTYMPPKTTGKNVITYSKAPIPDLPARYFNPYLNMDRLFIIQFNISFFVSKILLLSQVLYKDITKEILLLLTKVVVYYHDMRETIENYFSVYREHLEDYYNIPKTYFINQLFGDK